MKNCTPACCQKLSTDFIINSSLPVVIFPLIAYWLLSHGLNPESTYSLVNHALILSALLGIAGIIYQLIKKHLSQKNLTLNYALFGLIQGALFVTLGMSQEVPNMLQIPQKFQYIPWIIAPIFYSLLWATVIQKLNKSFNIQ